MFATASAKIQRRHTGAQSANRVAGGPGSCAPAAAREGKGPYAGRRRHGPRLTEVGRGIERWRSYLTWHRLGARASLAAGALDANDEGRNGRSLSTRADIDWPAYFGNLLVRDPFGPTAATSARTSPWLVRPISLVAISWDSWSGTTLLNAIGNKT
jgi:hypothetical protein